jgi:hypothetical protein
MKRIFLIRAARASATSWFECLEPDSLETHDKEDKAMTDPLPEQEASMSKLRIIAITITILAVGALAIWQGLELALRLTS